MGFGSELPREIGVVRSRGERERVVRASFRFELGHKFDADPDPMPLGMFVSYIWSIILDRNLIYLFVSHHFTFNFLIYDIFIYKIFFINKKLLNYLVIRKFYFLFIINGQVIKHI